VGLDADEKAFSLSLVLSLAFSYSFGVVTAMFLIHYLGIFISDGAGGEGSTFSFPFLFLSVVWEFLFFEELHE
jgi:hypothetical protein